jgi:dienelactone hydrolase
MRSMTIQLEGFSVGPMTFDGVTREVYRRGSGPGVIVMHEVPGITPEVATFARIVADAGFTVLAPTMFGTPDKPMTFPYAAGQILRACVSKEFSVLARNGTSPIISWLRALCAATHAELGGPGVGAIGMCLTGNFALALMVEPSMMAPVLAQPSLPFALSKSFKRALHLSPEDLVVVKKRSSEEGVPLLAMRFTGDIMCPAERFQRLREELGDRFEGIEIDSKRGNAHGIKMMAHSVVTNDLVNEAGHPTRVALDRVLAFFKERLHEAVSPEAAAARP